jgi:tetratricopeptide (TPR) repeat protein
MATPGLTVTLIARDERENLEELLPVLVAGADEVVVVDTGSRDGSPETARRLGARVVEHPWEDHFARARNRGLDETHTSHAMWVDADDRINVTDLRTVRREALRRGDVGLMLRLVSENPNPDFVSSCHQLRVFPARPEHRFAGRIHEQIQPSLAASGTRIERLDVPIRHLGYSSEAEVARKSRRNLELCRREYEEGRRGIASVYHYVKAASLCGELDEGLRVARACVENPPPDSSPDILQNVRVTLGRMEWQRGRHGEAELVYRAAVQAVPTDPFARLFLGELLLRDGRVEEAVEHLELARVSPLYGTRVPMPEAGLRRAARQELGAALEQLGRPAEAVAVYREGRGRRPDDPTLGLRLARALLATGETAEARQVLAEIPRGEADGSESVRLRAHLAFLEARDDEAETLYDRVAAAFPSAPIVALRRGLIARRSGRADEARTLLLQALDAYDDRLRRGGPDPGVLTRLADCYRGLGEPQAARLGYEEALRCAPGFPEAVRALEELNRGQPLRVAHGR